MGTVSKYVTLVEKLYYNNKKLNRCFFNKKEAYEAYFNKHLVFSRQLYELSANDIEVSANGGKISDFIPYNIFSTRKDVSGNLNDVPYDYLDFEIPPNQLTTLEKTGTFKIGQHTSNLELEVKYILEANRITVTYDTPVATRIYVDDDIAANGDGVTVFVEFKLNKKTTSTATGSVSTEITGLVEADTIVGEKIINNLNVYTADGMVYGLNLEYSETSRREVFKVKLVIFTANSKSATATTNFNVWQEANVKSIESIDYTLTASSEVTQITAASANISISGKSTKIENYLFTSGKRNKSGTLSSNSNVRALNKTSNTDVTSNISNTTVSGEYETSLWVPSNSSTTSTVTYEVTVEAKNGIRKTITITQEKDAIAGTAITNIVAYDISVEDALANGTDIDVAMVAKVTTTTTWHSGKTENSYSYPSATITSITRNNQTQTSATLAVDNLGTTPKDKTLIYTITKVVGRYNNTNITWTGTRYVYQEANTRSQTGTGNWSTSISPTTSTVESGSGYKREFTGSCSRIIYYTWTSGSNDSGVEYGNCTVSGTKCSVSPTSFNGQSTKITATTYNNTDYTGTFGSGTAVARSLKVTISGQGSTSASATITQSKGIWELTSSDYGIGKEGGTIYLTGTTTCNGERQDITASGTGVTIGTITYSGTSYSIPVTIGANTGLARVIDITIKNATKTVTAGINQEAAIVKRKANVVCYGIYTNQNMNTVNYTLYFDATNSSLYSGGEFSNVVLKLKTETNNGTIDASLPKTIGTVNVETGKKSSTYTGTISVNSSYVGQYIWIDVLDSTGSIGDGQIEEYIPE